MFTPEALEQVWRLTQGQPWLVNALAYEACFEMPEGRDRNRPIDSAMIDQAKENLIPRRVTHLDRLADKLREPRARRVIAPMLAVTGLGTVPEDDRQYLVDLGLLRRGGAGGLVVANPIYREVLQQALSRDCPASGADGLPASGRQRRAETGAWICHRRRARGAVSALR